MVINGIVSSGTIGKEYLKTERENNMNRLTVVDLCSHLMLGYEFNASNRREWEQPIINANRQIRKEDRIDVATSIIEGNGYATAHEYLIIFPPTKVKYITSIEERDGKIMPLSIEAIEIYWEYPACDDCAESVLKCTITKHETGTSFIAESNEDKRYGHITGNDNRNIDMFNYLLNKPGSVCSKTHRFAKAKEA